MPAALVMFLLASFPASSRPLAVWDQVHGAFLALFNPALGPTSGPPPAFKPVADHQPAFYRRAVEASIEVLVDDHLNGTGFLVSPGGYAMTAAHVVQTPGRRIEARTALGRVDAEVVALDLGHDLGLIKLKPATPQIWPTLELADASPVVATPVYLLGTPLYRHHVLFQGSIARDTPTYEYLPDEQRYVRIMHLSGMSPPGTSGGPWMLASGAVVGVQSGLMHANGSYVGVAYMAPLDAIRALVKRAEDARTPSLGVAVEELWEQPDQFLQRFPKRTEGVMVSLVVPNGPAEGSGLRSEDLITHVDGQRVIERDELLGYIRSRAPGDTVDLLVVRPGESDHHIQIKLDWLEARARPNP